MILAHVTQKDPHDSYLVGSCSSVDRSSHEHSKCDWNVYDENSEALDWEYGSEDCYGNQSHKILCSRLDPTVCPPIRGRAEVRWDSDMGPPHVICSYPLEDFQEIEDIKKYLSVLGKNKTYHEEIMPYFCSKTVETCPENLDKNRFLSCSRFVSNGVDGDFCREWAKENPQISDKTMVNYCKQNGTEDCSCISEDDPDVCDRYHCNNPSYLSTTGIKGRVKLCQHPEIEKNENNHTNRNKRATSWLLIFVIIFFVLVIISVVALVANKYYNPWVRENIEIDHLL